MAFNKKIYSYKYLIHRNEKYQFVLKCNSIIQIFRNWLGTTNWNKHFFGCMPVWITLYTRNLNNKYT